MIERRHGVVVAVVVDERCTGADDEPPRHACRGIREHVGDDVGERAAAGGDDRLRRIVVAVEERLVQGDEVADEVRGAGQRVRRATVRDGALVAGEAGQPQTWRGEHTLGQGDRGVRCAGPGASSGAAELDEHVPGVSRAGRGQRVDPAVVVDPAPQVAASGDEVIGEPRDRRGVDQLVGEHDVADALGARDAHLPGRGEGESGRPGIQLISPQLRGCAARSCEASSVEGAFRLRVATCRMGAHSGRPLRSVWWVTARRPNREEVCVDPLRGGIHD